MVRNPKLRPSPTPWLVAVGILVVATLAFCWRRTSADPPPAKFDLPVAEPASVEVLAEPERVEPPRRSKVDPELAKRETAQRSAAPISPVAVIRGRLLQAGGAPAADGLVGVVRLANSTWSRPTTDGSMVVNVPAKAEGTAVECSPDGSFELRVGATGRHALVGYEDGWRPTTVVVDVRAGSRVDAGTLVLESGHAITGRAVRLGAPLAGATISLAPPRVMWAADPAEVQRG